MGWSGEHHHAATWDTEGCTTPVSALYPSFGFLFFFFFNNFGKYLFHFTYMMLTVALLGQKGQGKPISRGEN